MSNEYIPPPVLLFGAAGMGASVTSRRPLSSPGVPFVCAYAADRTSKEARAAKPNSLPERPIAQRVSVSLDSSSSTVFLWDKRRYVAWAQCCAPTGDDPCG